MVSAVKGYRCIITMPDNATKERVKIMKAYGAEVLLTPASLRMQGAIDEASRIASETPNSFIPMQFENPANADAHRFTTAAEIFESFDGKLDALVLTARKKELKPEEVEIELMYDDENGGFSAEAYWNGRKQIYVMINIIEALRIWLEEYLNRDPFSGIELILDDEEGIIAHIS